MSDNLRRLIEEFQSKHGERYTLEVIATEAGVPLEKMEQLLNNQVATATLATVDRLCRYFQLKRIDELVVYMPSEAGNLFGKIVGRQRD